MWAVESQADDEQYRRLSAPENEVPAAVAVSAVLGRTDAAAVSLTGVQVFSTGLSFELGLRCRPEAAELLEGRNVGDLLWGHGGRGAPLLIGVQFSDGRRASNVPGEELFTGPAAADSVLLHQAGGGGGQLSADQSWWLSPLPPDGPLRIVVRCDVLGLDETVTELDGTAIRAAAAGVVTLWPWVSPQAVQPPEPPALDLPAGSWFARGSPAGRQDDIGPVQDGHRPISGSPVTVGRAALRSSGAYPNHSPCGRRRGHRDQRGRPWPGARACPPAAHPEEFP